MNGPLRRAGVVVIILFGLLFANLNWVQGYKADAYRTSDFNGRVQIAEYERARGVIEVDGRALAESKLTDGELKYLRSYPLKSEFAHVVGYKPVNLGATGIERAENEFLAGTSDRLFADRFRDMFTGQETAGGNVVLTLSLRAQQAAIKGLADNDRGSTRGAAVAINPKTGAIQAFASMPSFDPNPLASHDLNAAEAAYKELEGAKDGPLKNRVAGEVLPPGSTFKVIDAAAALQSGYTPETSIPAGSSYTPPTSGAPIRNAAASICPESQVTLKEAVTESCNTGFARLAVTLGADKIKQTAQAFGFEDTQLTVGNLDGAGLPVAASRTGDMQNPDGSTDPAALAQSGIGQNNVRMTPLQGAMIAATVANGGERMRPYLVKQLLGPDRRTIGTAAPKKLNNPISGSVASQLQEMMESAVQNGTGRTARISGYTVGGKTGTAQDGEDPRDHGWFIGYVLKDGEPISAVCVLLERTGESGGGSAEAAKIGGQIMKAVIADGGD
ncbi:penicillin-binding transpeptidase domain-containing protein [Actinomycetes bacterium KLBMP 9797]